MSLSGANTSKSHSSIPMTSTGTTSGPAPASSSSAPKLPPNAVTFTVVSYNVNFGSCYDDDMKIGDNTNAARVLRAIAESDADVVCLQETHGGWAKAIAEHTELAKRYPPATNQAWHHPNTGYYASGLGVLWKTPHKLLHHTLYQPKIVGSFFPGQRVSISLFDKPSAAGTPVAATTAASAVAAASTATAAAAVAAAPAAKAKPDTKSDIKSDGKLDVKADAKAEKSVAVVPADADGRAVVDIVNVHLRPPLAMGGGDDNTGAWANTKAYMWETTAVRMQELAAFCSQPGMRKPDILVGDCNEGSTGSAVSWMLGNGFADALDHPQCNTKTTWYWPLFWKVELFGSYDHVFYATERTAARALTCNGCHVFDGYKHASDHLPVKGTFTLYH